jgi:predicted RNA-binding protein YlqC (UPF0109 family)
VKEFLEFVIGQLIDRPEELILHEQERGGTVCFLLELPRSEVGKVIGKQGHTIQAIRSLLASAAARHGQRATLEIVERAG